VDYPFGGKGIWELSVNDRELTGSTPVPHFVVPVAPASHDVLHDVVLDGKGTIAVFPGHSERLESVECDGSAPPQKDGGVTQIVVDVNAHYRVTVSWPIGPSRELQVVNCIVHLPPTTFGVVEGDGTRGYLVSRVPTGVNGGMEGATNGITSGTSHCVSIITAAFGRNLQP
jgi:hypothetical protein